MSLLEILLLTAAMMILISPLFICCYIHDEIEKNRKKYEKLDKTYQMLNNVKIQKKFDDNFVESKIIRIFATSKQ